MATEKILNTRIQLKYDTLANWNNSTFILKKGEVAVVTVPTAEGSTLEPVMFKVGDGAKTFKQLDWASAKAADVYSWAKQSGISVVETAGTNDGSYVTGLKWVNNQLVPEIVAFDTIIDASTKDSTNAPQTKAVKTYVDQEVAKAVSGGVEGLATKTYVDDQDAADRAYADGLFADAKKYADDNEKTSSVSSGSTVIKVDPITTGNNTDYKVSIDLSGYQAKGDYKTIQDAVTSPAANGNATAFIDSISQDTNGVITATKKSIDLSGYKTKQDAVTDLITDKAHVLDSLTQNANGEISYEVRTLTPDDIGAKSKQTAVSKTLIGAQVVGTISQNENGVITVTDRTITAADLGLDSAMHFIGVSATAPAKGPGNRELQSGDVYLNSANNTEYVWADGKWNELGDEGTAGSHALKTTTIPGGLLIESTAKLDGSGAINHGTPAGAKAHTSTANNGSNPLEQGATLKLPTVTTDSFGHVIGTGTEDVILPSISIDFDANTVSSGSGVTYNVKIDGASVLYGNDTLTSKNYVDDAIARVAGKDGNGKEVADTYKVKQTAVSDPTANGKSLTFIDTISQDTEGVITATKKNVNLDAYALKADLPEIPDIAITETKGELGISGTIFVSGKLQEDTATGHTISQPMFGLTQQGDIEFVTDNQTIEADAATTKAVSFAIKDGAVTAEKTAAYTTENSDGTHTASTEVWVLYGGSATENI